jgi:hypothetical protein
MTFLLQAAEVESLIDGPDVGQLEIVDCRGIDRADGWIAGSTNFPSDTQNPDSMAAFLDGAIARGKQLLVFHCMHSQVRGPKGANLAVSVLTKRGLVHPRIAVLSGGWVSFKNEVGERRPQLCEYPGKGN